MKSLWDEQAAAPLRDDPLALRVYSSRLLGREPSLVLHGGGNTSVKASVPDIYGEQVPVLYVKGSGWDLATIEPEGFASVRLEELERMAELPELSDADMVRAQRAAMMDPDGPTPSVEAVLHAIVPFAWVDHTHADAVVSITNTADGEGRIRSLFGARVLVVPYVMPGFELARAVRELTREIDWEGLEAMILLNHGVFTFGDTAEQSYQRMIDVVSRAEDHLQTARPPSRGAVGTTQRADRPCQAVLLELAELRKAIGAERGRPVVATLDRAPETMAFVDAPNLGEVAARGPMTPDHVLRTKRIPMIVEGGAAEAVAAYAHSYRDYFDRHADDALEMLDAAPRWVLWPGVGSVAVGDDPRGAGIVSDIARHTMRGIEVAEAMGGWVALPEAEIFRVEYWELEQAKLRRSGAPARFAGRAVLVSGAANGIGRAVAEAFRREGAAVVATDIDPRVETLSRNGFEGIIADATDPEAVQRSVEEAIRLFGGLDILVCNAGVFTQGQTIEELDETTWQRSLDVNLTGYLTLLRAAAPYLRRGFDPSVVFVGSKNVPAPGPGAAAYSVAKAGATQLARVAALELAPAGVRVNVVHPHAVFDTAAWSDEVVAARARHYGITPEEYRSRNLLGVELTSADVASAVTALAGPDFSRTTGAQIPLDGGSDRVI